VIVARRRALAEELASLRQEITAYESLRDKTKDFKNKFDTDDLGLIPILARIAQGLSQRQLAELLGLKEQQIQRYESEEYKTIGLTRYQKIIEALGLKISLEKLPQSKEGRNVTFNFRSDVIKEVNRRRWLGTLPPLDTASALDEYVRKGRELSAHRAFHRKSEKNTADTEDTLLLWQARVMHIAKQRFETMDSRFNLADMSWVKQLTALSVKNDGPKLAWQFLEAKGIVVVVEPQLPGTRLDGAAMLLEDRTPVIANAFKIQMPAVQRRRATQLQFF
jgi:HTH-type transcriptional regulator/antitoxin HigA